jgi:hypothetical protein
VIKLFAPQETGKGLTLHATRIFRESIRLQLAVKLIRFLAALNEDLIECLSEKRILRLPIRQAKLNRAGASRFDRDYVVCGGFGPTWSVLTASFRPCTM